MGTVDVKTYFAELEEKVGTQYKIAGQARKKGFDPSTKVEPKATKNMAERVEGLVGPIGVAKLIKDAQDQKIPREKIIQSTIDWILNEKSLDLTKEQRVEQALRTAMAIQTEGVVSAPLEGISQVKIEENPDGSQYLGVYYAGPIRAAGGTAAALSVLYGDYIRKRVGISDYRPTEDEIERYKEEIHIYHKRIVRLQYFPTDAQIEMIVRNVPVCINGDPTEKIEVDVHKNLPRVKTNRIRGGLCLVIGEGIAQKAKKVLKTAEKMGVDWSFLSDIKKAGVQDGSKQKTGKKTIEPNPKFLDDIVAGRPIFAYPMRPGGWRLRYGRSNTCGVASKAIHPACMEVLDEFPVLGTQLRIERPGKGTVATPCSEIEPPVIKDKFGSVIKVETVEEAKKLRETTVEILSLGDMLIPFGDFLNYNETLAPSGYVEEWWEEEYKTAGGTEFDFPDIRAGRVMQDIPAKKAIEISRELDIPLHPKYTYSWHDISVREVKLLISWLESSILNYDSESDMLEITLDARHREAKRALELLLIPHTVSKDGKTLKIKDYGTGLLLSLGIISPDELKSLNFDSAKEKVEGLADEEDGLFAINVLSPIKVMKKTGCYIGARMGRPEKAKERMMTPAPHVLFPIKDYGTNIRSLNKVVSNTESAVISCEVADMKCPNCGKQTYLTKCPECDTRTEVQYHCNTCGYKGKDKLCPKCKKRADGYREQDVAVRALYEKANSIVHQRSNTILKAVKGMMSADKIPEPLLKGILRVNNGVYVFKDGTIRYDATDVPTTHFRPIDINTSVERVKSLGYGTDIYGEPLVNGEQILEIFVQDIIVPTHSLGYLTGICNFVDDELKHLYGMDAFYNIKSPDDIVGQLVAGLAPHTSAATIGRIIGHCEMKAILAHPFWHCAKRRNCDGDEDAIMILMDALLNFSFSYLPSSRGGRMDAPLVINTVLDPKEVDDEAHNMERVYRYPLEFYQKTLEMAAAKDVAKMIDTVEGHLEDPSVYHLGLTHFSSWAGVPTKSRYVTLGEMSEKTDIELKLCKRIRAADESDVAKRIIESHLIRDTYGNLRAFARQKIRCVKCNAKYRRVPLLGKCDKCGGKLLLTVSEGTVTKYVPLTKKIVDEYVESEYIRQRIELLGGEIKSVFENDRVKQFSLSDFA